MKRIKPSNNPNQWPRNAVKTIETRKRDLVIRIADWTRDKEEPAYDVEVYIGGVYDWHESPSFTVHPELIDGPNSPFYATKAQAKLAAIRYAQTAIAKLL